MSKVIMMDDPNGNDITSRSMNLNDNNNNYVNNNNLTTANSNEDLSSQSLSEYTDADESISAPTEFLAEFLSAIMLKDYKNALKYCKLILQYEPNNTTAKEIYPFILKKLRNASSNDNDANCNKYSSSSPDLILKLHSANVTHNENDQIHEPYLKISIQKNYDCNLNWNNGNVNNMKQKKSIKKTEGNFVDDEDEEHASSSIGLTLSESADENVKDQNNGNNVDIVDEENDEDDVADHDNDDDEIDNDDDEDECGEADDIITSSSSGTGDDLPVDEQQIIKIEIMDLDSSLNLSHGSTTTSHNSLSGSKASSDNTTHSYSSLLLEEDDMVTTTLQLDQQSNSNDFDISNGNKLPSASCSDSESPTEPLTQRLAAILRSKCGISNIKNNSN